MASPVCSWQQELARTHLAGGTLLFPALHIPPEQAQPRASTGEHPRPDPRGPNTPKIHHFSALLQAPARVPATSSLKEKIKYRVFMKTFFTPF